MNNHDDMVDAFVYSTQAQPCADPDYNKLHRKIRRGMNHLKRTTKMFLHMIFYRILFAIGLGWPYQRMMCRLNLYRKFPDGRCMFCGLIEKPTE
jgi:hypothetical protein